MINRLYSYFQMFLGVFILIYAVVRVWGFFFAGSEAFAYDLLLFTGHLLLVHVALALGSLVETHYSRGK